MSLQEKIIKQESNNNINRKLKQIDNSIEFTEEELRFVLDKLGECHSKIADIQFVYDIISKMYNKYQEMVLYREQQG